MGQITKTGFVCFGLGLTMAAANLLCNNQKQPGESNPASDSPNDGQVFLPPDTSLIQNAPDASLIRYGRTLVAETRKYLGPNGTVAQISNKLNCQSCHLDAGAKAAPFSSNFMGVAANYPVYRERSGVVETIPYRVNDCMVRSMDGQPLDTSSREMKAMVAYILWLGKDVPAKVKPVSAQIEQLPYLPRAADTILGKHVFIAKCQLCHGINGIGGYSVDSVLYYPPLWGEGSFNTAAGMFRISRLAGFAKNNMPFGVSHGQSQLTNEEAWDVAAYIISQPRPHKDFPEDWPDISKKVIDHPFGPYTDGFSEQQHKFGPFEPIVEQRNKKLNEL